MKRFWDKVHKTDNCWIWTASKITGYGQFWLDGKSAFAHRVSYHFKYPEFEIKGKQYLDHLCRNKSCVNPAHLEIVSNRENTIRGKRSKLNKNKKSKYVGVTWDKQKNKWKAQAQINGKYKHLGYSAKESKAGELYQKAIAKLENLAIIAQ